jgi:hypothetical protein
MQGNECKERTSLDGLKNKLVELRVMIVERWKRRRRGREEEEEEKKKRKRRRRGIDRWRVDFKEDESADNLFESASKFLKPRRRN